MVTQSNKCRQKKRKLLVLLATIGLVAFTFGISAAAANTTDVYYYVTWSYSQPSFQLIQNDSNSNYNHYVYRNKTDSTPVFFRINGSSSVSYAYVKVCGVPSSCISSTGYGNFTKSDTINLTCDTKGTSASYAICNVGTAYSVSSLVYEKGYKYCTLQLQSNLGYGTGYGYWSADTASTHTIPTYVY